MHERCSSLVLGREGLRVAKVHMDRGLVFTFPTDRIGFGVQQIPEAYQEFISMLRAAQLNLG